MLSIRTILHPTDFSDHAANAYRLAVALTRDYGARLVIAHVAPTPMMTFSMGVIPPPPVTAEEKLFAEMNKYVAKEKVDNVDEIVVEGDPAMEILKLAEEEDCDLIVMGTHGLTGLERLLMGSVAEKVLRRAPCPVLTVRMPPKIKVREDDVERVPVGKPV
jgi:nucleotide-binding universal stress UspA family protein